MRVYFLLIVFGILLNACGSQAPSSQPEYRPTATVKDIMTSIIDPSADGVWAAVKTTIDASGTHEQVPETDEEWAAVRRHTITLMEASNLLLVPGRRIAPPGTTVENPKFENPPELVEAKMNEDKESWMRMSHDLQTAAVNTLKAVDARNAQAVFDAGAVIYQACEKCHNRFWIPQPPNAQ